MIFAGFRSGFSVVTNRTYARDVRYLNSTWRRMDDMPLASGITHMATVSVGSIVYLCGGYHGPHPGPHTSICFQYNHSIAPGTGAQWSYLPSLPNGGSAGGGMIYSTAYNTLYYTGGGQRLVPGTVQPVDLNSTWKLALHNQSAGWLPSTPLPYLANHLSYVTHRDTLGYERHYVLAGQVAENECCGNLAYNYEFLPRNETWIQRASMPIPRGHAASSTRAFGCGFIIAGGSINNPNRTSTTKIRTDDVSYYDVYKDSWVTAIGKLPAIGATPIVDIHNNGYMHFISPLPLSERRRITVEYQ
jgi:Kelch motif